MELRMEHLKISQPGNVLKGGIYVIDAMMSQF
jgi:hypothetical protein